jgi:ubiquitin carboxyl-terminal hydrolase 14
VAPQFAETSPGGRYAQQDAEEAWLRLLSAIQNTLKGTGAPSTAVQSSNANSSFVEQYMTGRMAIK